MTVGQHVKHVLAGHRVRVHTRVQTDRHGSRSAGIPDASAESISPSRRAHMHPASSVLCAHGACRAQRWAIAQDAELD